MAKKIPNMGSLLSPGGSGPMLKPAKRQMSADTDKLGAYPANVRVPVLEGRRYLWTTRVFAIGFYLSVILNIVLVLAIYTMLPLKKIEPFLVSFSDKQDQVVYIQPAATVQNGFNVFVEKLASEYVKIRQELLADPEEQKQRWLVYMRSRMTQDAHAGFIKGVQPVFEELQQKGYHRKVDILGTARGNTDNYLIVRYKTIDYNRAGEIEMEQYWKAKLRYGFIQQQTTSKDRYLNPFGFIIRTYSIERDE